MAACLASPETVSSILLGPGERIDVLVDFSGFEVGKEIYLVSNKYSKYNVQGRQSYSLLKFRVDRTPNSNFTVPSTLSSIRTLNPSLSVKTRTIDIAQTIGGAGGHGGMGRHSINGKILGQFLAPAEVRLLDPASFKLRTAAQRRKAVTISVRPRPSREERLAAAMARAEAEAFSIPNEEVAQMLRRDLRIFQHPIRVSAPNGQRSRHPPCHAGCGGDSK